MKPQTHKSILQDHNIYDSRTAVVGTCVIILLGLLHQGCRSHVIVASVIIMPPPRKGGGGGGIKR